MWFQIRSWHRLALTSRGGQHKARCGKWSAQGAPLANVLPLGHQSCETCLRLTEHDREKG